MNIGRTWANLTTSAVKFEPGNIKDAAQAQAFEDAKSLVAQTDKIAKDMLSLDNGKWDLNSEIKGNVYIKAPNESQFVGHCTTDEKGNVNRLEVEKAFGGADKYSVEVEGDRKVVHSISTFDNVQGSLTTETWVIFDGSQASFKRIKY